MQRTQGFTLVELVVALLIGSILTSVALSTFNTAQTRLAVRNAKSTYVSLHARARAIGIERGATGIWVDSTGDSVLIANAAGVQEVIRFGADMNIDLRSTPAVFRLCMTARGYAEPSCNTTPSLIRLQFWQSADSTSLLIMPTGQLMGM